MAPSRPKRATWFEESLNEAVNAVRCGRLSIYKAAAQYDIPRRTIRNHSKGGISHQKIWKNAIFTPKQAKDFVSRIIKFSVIVIRVQALAFCNKIRIVNNFNRETCLAGNG